LIFWDFDPSLKTNLVAMLFSKICSANIAHIYDNHQISSAFFQSIQTNVYRRSSPESHHVSLIPLSELSVVARWIL
jgi:hypothetical protein